MDGLNLNTVFGAPDPFDDPIPKTTDDNSFLDNIDGLAWDEQVAKERAPIDGEEALRLLLKKYHTQVLYFRSIDMTWRRCIDILQIAMNVKELKGLRYSDRSDEGGFVLSPTDEASFCFRVRQPEGRLVMREVRFHPQALRKQPFAFAAYTRDPTLSEKNYPVDFEPSMFASDDVIALKTRTATWSVDEFDQLRAAFEKAGVPTFNSEQQCIDDMLL